MKANRLHIGMCLVALAGFAAVLPGSVSADTKTTAKKGPAEPPQVTKAVTISPSDLSWGIDTKKVASIYDKIIDEDYKDKYKKVQPGPAMDALDAEVAEKKSVLRRSLINFEDTPTGLDNGPLRNEFTYNNKEAMMKITRNGKTRDFFFIQGKLWKIIDELPVGAGSTWGKDFTEVATGLATYYGVAGGVRDPDANQAYTEIVWKDSNTLVRAVDWQTGKFGLVFQDAVTTNQLGSLRTNKVKETSGVDDKVKDVMHTPSAPPDKTVPDKNAPKK